MLSPFFCISLLMSKEWLRKEIVKKDKSFHGVVKFFGDLLRL
jgi:hypothetical protein